MTDADMLGLRQCAEHLGVHYMTVYRYVRTGMLPATKQGSEWRVASIDLKGFAKGADPTPVGSGAPWALRLESRLVAGDERGAWQVVESALTSGMTPPRVHLEMIEPAMHRIGEGWAAGRWSIADEHRASAVAHRLVGRLGGRFAVRGRPKGRVVVGTPPGERHMLPVAVVADLLRGVGFEVVELGSDLPVADFVTACRASAPLIAVGVSVSNAEALAAATALLERLRLEDCGPILIGGGAVRDAGHARSLGADLYAVDGNAAVAAITELKACITPG